MVEQDFCIVNTHNLFCELKVALNPFPGNSVVTEVGEMGKRERNEATK